MASSPTKNPFHGIEIIFFASPVNHSESYSLYRACQVLVEIIRILKSDAPSPLSVKRES